jgi:hypothetical protein
MERTCKHPRGQPLEHRQELDQQSAERPRQHDAVQLRRMIAQVPHIESLRLDAKRGEDRHLVGGVQDDPLGNGEQGDLTQRLQRAPVDGIECNFGRVDEGDDRQAFTDPTEPQLDARDVAGVGD